VADVGDAVAPAVIVVVGPTAAGKSDLAVELARRLGAEVVNADSMQLYRGMDIGTGKLTTAEQRGVPHHLLDVWDVSHTASVVEFRALAHAAFADIAARGLRALLVGGSGLYVHAVVDAWDFPGTDPALRAALEQRLDDEGAAALHAELADVDPAAAARIQSSNGRRIVRALEVVQLQGSFRAELPSPGAAPALDCVMVGLDVPRDQLDQRIEARVRRMWDAGWVDEVRRLDAAGLREGRTASRALGYRQILAMLDGDLDGDLDEASALLQTVQATRRFARRQGSWFARDPRIRWLPFDAAELVHRVEEAVERPRQRPPTGPS